MSTPYSDDSRLLHSRKRARGTSELATDSSDASEGTEDEQVEPRKRGKKVAKRVSSSKAPRYLEVHVVECDRNGEGHGHHLRRSNFLAAPRIFTGDGSKQKPLRGMMPLGNIDDYLKKHKEVSFYVQKKYNCHAYHESVTSLFERMHVPQIDHDALFQIKQHLFILPSDKDLTESLSDEITIVSKSLETAMTNLEESYPEAFGDWQEPENFKPPYLPFYHNRHMFEDILGELPATDSEQLSLLLEYVLDEYGAEYEDADSLFASGAVSKAHLSKLFRPNEVVISFKEDQPVAFMSIDRPKILARGDFNLDCWCWNYDGGFRKAESTIRCKWPTPESDLVPISSLTVYPLRFDTTGLEEKLQERGNTFWKCRKRNYVSYTAPKQDFEVHTGHPRYMVDNATYRQMHQSGEPHLPQGDDLDPGALECDEPPEYPFVLLLPTKILGFGFHDKKWRSLLVEHISSIEWNKASFDQRLVLKSAKKDLLKALVTVHLSSIKGADVIEGKGNGLIILLHGGPGTGKTLTAETIAEFAEKPLYRVTCGDIGTNAEDVEKYLESVLYIGTIWECVVLLDEADVFLEERTQTDLQRNALVSVFLRVLDYYDGILILTSNRVGTFDEAFKSRVQLAMHYPDLEQGDRWEIWNNFISDLGDKEENINHEELKSKIDVLARSKLNGRQIRNVVKTARQLAIYKGGMLGYTHFEQAIDVAKEFEDYLVKTRGHTDEEYARAQNTRS